MVELLLAEKPEAQDSSLVGFVAAPTWTGRDPQPWVLFFIQTAHWALDHYGHPQRYNLRVPVVVQGIAATNKIKPILEDGHCLWVRGSLCDLSTMTDRRTDGIGINAGSIALLGRRKHGSE